MKTPRIVRFTGEIAALSPISYTIAGIAGIPRLGGRPYLTASALRGIVRHGGSDILCDLIGFKPNPDDHFLLAQGGIVDKADKKGKKDKKDKTEGEGEGEKSSSADSISPMLRERFARVHNPLVHLFGSMVNGVGGRLWCEHAIAKTPGEFFGPMETEDPKTGKRREYDPWCDTVRHSRCDDLARNPDRFDWSADEVESYLLRREEAKKGSEIKQRKRAAQRQLSVARAKNDAAAIAEARAALAIIETELAGIEHVSLAQPDLSYECIRKATVFAHSWMLRDPSDAELELFMLALDAWAAWPYYGGRWFHGCGQVSATYDVTVREAGLREWTAAGRAAFDGSGGTLEVTGRAAEWLEAKSLRALAAAGSLDLTHAAIQAAGRDTEVGEDEAA